MENRSERGGQSGCYYHVMELPMWVFATAPAGMAGGALAGAVDEGTVEQGPMVARWSSRQFAPPPIGARIVAYVNGRWSGIVESYFVEHGWLGIMVRAETVPAWYMGKGQRGADPLWTGEVHIFGVDLAAVDPGAIDLPADKVRKRSKRPYDSVMVPARKE